MVETRTIAVMGATGKQGRGVIDALLFCMGPVHYDVRPMSRSLTSKLAQRFTRDFPQLSLVKWQEEDTESLRQCFEGCYGAFIITNPLIRTDLALQELTRTEIELGGRCLEAAKAAKLSHIIYPTFPSIFNASNGRINIRRFEAKHQISLEIQSSFIPSTILCPGPFYTDFQKPQYAFREGDKVIFSTPASPDKKMGFADPGHDIGWFTRAAFNKGPEFMKRQYVPVCGQSISYDDLASKFFAVTGIKAEYRQCLVKEFEARFENFSEADRKDMGALAKWLAVAPGEGVCYGTIDMERFSFAERGLNVKALSWEAFLERTRWPGPPRKE